VKEGGRFLYPEDKQSLAQRQDKPMLHLAERGIMGKNGAGRQK
jgi:hypothetical protein